MNYRKLKEGEIIKEGDEYISAFAPKKYEPVVKGAIGQPILGRNAKYFRRPLNFSCTECEFISTFDDKPSSAVFKRVPNQPTSGQFVAMWEFNGGIWSDTCQWSNEGVIKCFNGTTDNFDTVWIEPNVDLISYYVKREGE